MQASGISFFLEKYNSKLDSKNLRVCHVKHVSNNEIVTRLRIMVHVLYELVQYLMASCITGSFYFQKPKSYNEIITR